MEQESIARQITAQIARLGTESNPFKAGLLAFEVRLALAALGPAAAPELRQYWEGANEHLRDIILDVLGKIGDADDVPWLLAPAAQPDHVWHHSALGSLARLAGDLALPLLTKTIADPNATPQQRHYAVSLLRFITSPPAAREAARDCARGLRNDTDERVRCDAAWAYYLLPEAPAHVSADAMQELLQPGQDIDIQKIACKAILQQRGEAALLEVWPRLLPTGRAQALGVAARRSGRAYDEYGSIAETVIQHGLDDPDELVRYHAVSAAAACRAPAVLERLLVMLSQERDDYLWYGLCDTLLLLHAREPIAALYSTWPRSQRDRLRAYLRVRRRDAPSDTTPQAELVALAATLPGSTRRRPQRGQTLETSSTVALASPPEQLTAQVSLVIPLPASLPLKRPRRPAVTLAAGPLAVHWELAAVVETIDMDTPLHSIHTSMRFHDSAGQPWRATARLRPANFCAALLGATSKPLPVHRAERVPPAWHDGLTAGLLLGGLRDLWDAREYIVLRLDGEDIEISIKYQGPRFSLGTLGEASGNEAAILVEQLWHQGEPLPALVFCVPWAEVVFGYRWDARRQRWKALEDFRLTWEAV